MHWPLSRCLNVHREGTSDGSSNGERNSLSEHTAIDHELDMYIFKYGQCSRSLFLVGSASFIRLECHQLCIHMKKGLVEVRETTLLYLFPSHTL